MNKETITFRLWSGAYVDLIFPTEMNSDISHVKHTTCDGAVAFEGDLTTKEWGKFFADLCALDAPTTHSWMDSWVDERV